MKSHRYLRAYMAGIVLPTLFLLCVITTFTIARCVYDVPIPIERAIVFPMALVPNLWGLWNILYVALHSRRWPLAIHGAMLPLLLIPGGVVLAQVFEIGFITPARAVLVAPVGCIVYYLAWKYLVGFFNRELGIAAA